MSNNISHTTNTFIGELRALMARRQVTQGDLAEVLGFSAQSMTRRMHGKTSFTIDELDEIAAYFDVPITSLLESSDPGQSGRTGTRRPPGRGSRTGRGFTGDEAMLVGAGIVTL